MVLNRRYRLDKRIRTSPESEVYLGFDSLLHRPVTVAVPSAGQGDRAQRYEAFLYRNQIASALHHRNIVAVLDIGEDHGAPYVVSEHFVGDTLQHIIQDEAPFDVDDVAILIEQLARGLDYAHHSGIVHGVLSPGDVIIDSAGLAKITNLGMIEGQLFLESGSRSPVSGHYLPGGLQGNSLVAHALDVHALAAIAYEMLVGRPPRAVSRGAASGRRSDVPRYVSPSIENRSVPERAGETVLRALQEYQERSGLTALQFSHALTNWRSWATQPARSSPRPSMTSRGNDASTASWSAPSQDWSRRSAPAAASPLSSAVATPRVAHSQVRFIRLLYLAIVLLSLAAVVTVYRDEAPQLSSTVSEVPAELDRLLGTTTE